LNDIREAVKYRQKGNAKEHDKKTSYRKAKQVEECRY